MKIFLIVSSIAVYILIGIIYIAVIIFKNPKEKLHPISSLFTIILWPIVIIIRFINKVIKR